MGDCNDVVEIPDMRRKSWLCHINLLKPYYTCDKPPALCITSQVGMEEDESEDEVGSVELVKAWLKNSSALANLRVSESSHYRSERGCITSSEPV